MSNEKLSYNNRFNDTTNDLSKQPNNNIVTPYKQEIENMSCINTECSSKDNNKRMIMESEYNGSEYSKPTIHSSHLNMISRALQSDDLLIGQQMLQYNSMKYNLGETALAEEVASIYVSIDENRNMHQVIGAQNYLPFVLENCTYKEHLTWPIIETFLTHSTNMLTDDERGIINITMVTCTLQILSKLLEQTLTDDELLVWFFEHKSFVHTSLTTLTKITGCFWNKYHTYLGINCTIPPCTDPNMPARVRMCFEEFGKAICSSVKVYIKIRDLSYNAPTVAMLIENAFWKSVQVTQTTMSDALLWTFVLMITEEDTEDMNVFRSNLLKVFRIDENIMEV